MTQGEQAQKKLFLCSSFFDAQHSHSKVFLAREIVFYINWFPHTASIKNPRFRHLPRAWSIRVSRAVDVYLELRKVWSATSYNTWWNDVEKVALHENKAENGSQQMESSKLKNLPLALWRIFHSSAVYPTPSRSSCLLRRKKRVRKSSLFQYQQPFHFAWWHRHQL